MTPDFKGSAVRARTSTALRLSVAIFASALLVPVARAQQTAPATPAHRSTAVHHRAAAHHAHHAPSHHAHSAAAAHRSAAHHAATAKKTPVKAEPSSDAASASAEDRANADQKPATPGSATEAAVATTAAAAGTPAAPVKTSEAAPATEAAMPAPAVAQEQPSRSTAPAPSQPAEPTPAAAATEQPAAIAPQAPPPAQPAQAETSTPVPAQTTAAATADQSSAPAQSATAPAAADQPASAQPTVTISVAPDQSIQQPQPALADQTAGQGQPSEQKPSAPDTSAADFAKGSTATEEDLRKMLVGKSLYLRGGYLDNNLTFGETGMLIGHSPQGSYTLSGIEIERVHLSKHKVELEGARYGLHFLGALPYEDPTKAVDRVKVTPKKKFVKITIDRELIVTPKKKKQKDQDKGEKTKTGPGGIVMPAEEAAATPTSTSAEASPVPESSQPAGAPDNAQASAAAQPAGTIQTASTADPVSPATDRSKVADGAKEPTDEEQAKAEMAAAPQEERPADPNSVTTTTSPAHAAKVLKDALDKIFAPGLDERMMAAMPEFWKRYYEAAAARTDYRPKDPTVLRQSAVDQKAALTSNFEPESNDFAQDNGVAGMCLYHAVIGADGKPGEIAVARPIGFGLDENAVAAIRKASFQPAMKDGKPVPVVLDLVVQFRIYSKRTNVASKPEDKEKPKGPQLPGPYTLQAERTNQAQAKTQAQ